MKTGMIRRIDELGRIVIPKEIRKNLKLNTGDIVEIYMDENNKIVLKKYSTLVGMEEELFNISKVINEVTGASILFVDQEKVIISYGKKAEIYFDKDINRNIYNKINEMPVFKTKDFYLINDYLESRQAIVFTLFCKNILQGLLIVLENEHSLSNHELELITHFKKFIVKQLDS